MDLAALMNKKPPKAVKKTVEKKPKALRKPASAALKRPAAAALPKSEPKPATASAHGSNDIANLTRISPCKGEHFMACFF